ncbi:MAG TPA: Rrf2 family transcriptional regulator [Hyphomicrobiaceae bacterium]|nr:Rrf2 family transcriptional regulator [Hyphomicrobiaceae bacterium]
MELNTKGRYAVTALADLARHAGEEAVPLSVIATRQGLSLAYLEQLFLKLRRAGLVESARGRTGGYKLCRPAESISVAEIMLAVEEGVRMTRCRGDDSAPCQAGERCLTHDLWDALGAEIARFLDRVTLAEVIDGSLGERRRASRASGNAASTGPRGAPANG